jgi:hypothetical protein
VSTLAITCRRCGEAVRLVAPHHRGTGGMLCSCGAWSIDPDVTYCLGAHGAAISVGGCKSCGPDTLEPVTSDGWAEFLMARAVYLRSMKRAGCSVAEMVRVCNLEDEAHAERILDGTSPMENYWNIPSGVFLSIPESAHLLHTCERCGSQRRFRRGDQITDCPCELPR